MRKDHAAAAPIAGGMRPVARRWIAHTMLLRQGQGNAALLQIRCAAAAGQGGLEGGELLCEITCNRLSSVATVGELRACRRLLASLDVGAM